MKFEIATIDDLKKVFNEEIKSIIISQGTSKKDWLTKEELINLTGWSERTIQHLRDSRQIPYSQHGRKILYPYKGICEFLERNLVTPKYRGI